MSDSESTNAWVTVAEAAEKADVDTGTIRQWYRSGRIPTRRAEGQRGAFLVPLDLVLSLVAPADGLDVPAASPASPSIDAIRDINAEYWSAETESTKQELAAVRTELSEAREQLEFLRTQLAEASGENRSLKVQLQAADDQRADLRAQLADAVDDRKGVEARLLTVEAELTQLRRSAARGSITDNSWLDQQTPAYESPVRRQAMAPPPPPLTTSNPGGPTAPFRETRSGELSDLLASTRPDGAADDADGGGEVDETTQVAVPRSRFADDYVGDEDDDYTASRAVWTDEAPHPPLGESPDDLLPDNEKKGRFGRK
jgi:hypothetical protein